MGDPLKKVRDGERLRIPAAAYNAFVDAARQAREDQQGVGGNSLRSTRSTSIVLVQNDTGGTVGRFGILGIDGPIVGPSANLDQFKQQVALVGKTPASGHAGKFVILLEPLVAGGIGSAVVDGVAVCRVVFNTGTETRADVLVGDTTRLLASAGGSAQVLWKESGTGEKWAVVRLETALTSAVRFRTTATLALGGTAAAVIRVWDGAAYQDGEAIVVEDFSSPGRWSAVNGAEGVAFRPTDKSEYAILWIEHQAIFATATLTANMTAGTAACTFTDNWQGPSGVGAASQVYDVDGRYAGLLTGDKVLACWDDVESKYKVCDGSQSPQLKWAYANADSTTGLANLSKVVCETAVGKDGPGAGGPTFDVYLPKPSSDATPLVKQGSVIGYMTTTDGFRVAVTDYIAGTGVDVVRFRTTAPLSLGGTAAALIRIWNGAAYVNGPAITVEDWTVPGRWSAVSGAEGMAVKLADKAEYIILWVEHQAIFVTVTLATNMAAGVADCTFTDTWQGNGVGAAFQVFDVNSQYAGLLTGDKVLACWDDIESKYKICDGPATATKEKWAYARADWTNGTLNSSFVPCDSAVGKDGPGTGINIGNVFLPRASAACDPNVRQGNIIAYTETEDGFKIAKGYLDDCLGTIKIWSGSLGTIKPGWQFCDGTNGAPDLREKFILGAQGDAGGTPDFDGEGSTTGIGATGGLRRKLVNWEHTRFGSPNLVTNSTQLTVSQTASFSTGKEDPPLTVSATGTGTASGNTEYALADLRIITENYETVNFEHIHIDHIHALRVTTLESVNPPGGLTHDILGGYDCAEAIAGTQVNTRRQRKYGDCGPLAFEHYLIEPGQSHDTYVHPVDPPGVAKGHRHPFENIVINASNFVFNLRWDDPNAYDGHPHPVPSGTLDGKLTIYDVTHGNIPAFHWHTIFLDNHQEYINRIPLYYALAYIMRVN